MGDELLNSPEFAEDIGLVSVAQGVATISVGAESPSVLLLQKALTALGIPLKPDGSFGPKTSAALASWQKSAGLADTGILDDATLFELDRALVQRRSPDLLSAIARAVGANPARPPEPPAPAPRGAAHDASFFVDGDNLPAVGSAAAEDPDFPPPAVDKAKPLVAPGTPLPADRNEMLARLRNAVGADAAANAALARILAAGRFHSGALLPNLAKLATTKRHPDLILQGGVESDLLVRQVLRHVDNPLRVQQGVGRGTCGAGVIEYLLLRRDASEFVRIVDSITGFTGEAKLKSGRTLKMPRTAITRDDTERTDVDRMFQSTIMNHATLMSWLFDYDNPKDDESFWASVKGNSQMPVWGFTSMYEDVLGESRTSISRASRPREEVAEGALAAVARGDRVPVILEFSSFHWLSVEWVTRGADGHVNAWILRNPWGWDDGSGPPKREPLPEGGGRIKMTPADFTNALFAAVVRP